MWYKSQHLYRPTEFHPGTQSLPLRQMFALLFLPGHWQRADFGISCAILISTENIECENTGIPCVTEMPFFDPLLEQRDKSWIQRAARKDHNQVSCLPNPNSRSKNLTRLVAHTHVQTGNADRQHYLLILLSYSVLCLLSSVFSSTTKLCKALEHLTESLEAAAGLLCSLLLLLLHASNPSMLFSRSAVLISLWDSEPWVTHSVLRELKVEESLARQAGQLLIVSTTEISHDDVDHVVLAILCVLRDRLDEGTLS